MKIFKRIIAAVIATTSMAATAEIPQNYYSSCENQSGTALLSALFSTISSHTNVGYDGLWSLYYTSDVRPNGTIWDMYSTKEWVPGQKQCGNYKLVGDCYNREHSLPKSWFKEASPMVSDAFHIYPTDGKVNGQRSNYPFGECTGGTTLAANGSVKALGRLGKSTYSGYSGTVFEPDDEYKGDFARSYFYMAACYYDRIANWSSDMLSGDKNTPFKSWAMEMLLKWHRQDPVSEKEINRNEAVYAAQHNRNPFIDHPELAEYIWGTNKGQKWTGSDEPEPTIHQPQHGTEINLGLTRPGVTVKRNITVHTSAASENVRVSVIGGGFSVSHTSLPAATANNGTNITLSYSPTETGSHAATLRVTNGEAVHSVTIRGQAIDGLPAGPATTVTDESFVATWVYVGDDDRGNYTLIVKDEAGVLDGYPKAVTATDGQYEVTGLIPATAYSYTISSTVETSDEVEVTTAEALPSIDFLFDGTLAFETTPGVPSEAAELMVDVDNVEGDFNVRVTAPFQISLDKNTWTTSLTLTPDDERLYMRLYSIEAGEFSTHIVATYGEYVSDDAYAEGFAEIRTAFFEDFEGGLKANYTEGDVAATACTWHMVDAGIYNSSQPTVSGTNAVRLGNTASSSIEMTTDVTGGIGTVSFYACRWNNSKDGEAKLSIETSTDGGNTYTSAGTVTVTDTDFKPFNVFVGVSGKARLKIRQMSGARANIDDIALSGFTTGCEYLDTDFHAWDAYGRNGDLIIEVTRELTAPVIVYALDGTTVFDSTLAPGTHTVAVAPGLYIVAIGDDARRVVVR